jgi:hypothetical protein
VDAGLVEGSALSLAGDDPFDDDSFGVERFLMSAAIAYEHRFGGTAASR